MRIAAIPPRPTEFCRALNTLGAWLALDDFGPAGPSAADLAEMDAILLFGNQAVATLTAACALARRAPQAQLLFSGGAGHSTASLFENLRGGAYASLVDDGTIHAQMAEAEIFAAVARHAFDLPADRILIERESRNTGENATFSLQTLAAHGIRHGRVLLLQDPILQRRAAFTWRRQADLAGHRIQALSHAAFVPRVTPGTSSAVVLGAGPSRDSWTLERYLGLLFGEIDRLRDDERGYGPRGKNFLPHIEIPQDISRSYRQALEFSGLMAAR
jgi:uncharacterized SAM-binding protein YcdF (DUF218 family)